jgi:ribosomal protein S18 acetylase RimI-like enzyme
MPPIEAKIRQMEPSDASQVFTLRRKAILDSPLAFLASPEDDVASSVEVVRELLGRAPDSVVFGAEAGELVGMLGVVREGRAKAAHKLQFWGMYVTPDCRGHNIGRGLLRSALLHARRLDGVATVNLSVAETADAARQLYESEGFVLWGVEPDAIRCGRESVAEYHMQLAL